MRETVNGGVEGWVFVGNVYDLIVGGGVGGRAGS